MFKALLIEENRNNRFKWAKGHKCTYWDQVIFSDETTMLLNQVKWRVWNLPDKKKGVRNVKHSEKVNVWIVFRAKALEASFASKRT